MISRIAPVEVLMLGSSPAWHPGDDLHLGRPRHLGGPPSHDGPAPRRAASLRRSRSRPAGTILNRSCTSYCSTCPRTPVSARPPPSTPCSPRVVYDRRMTTPSDRPPGSHLDGADRQAAARNLWDAWKVDGR